MTSMHSPRVLIYEWVSISHAFTPLVRPLPTTLCTEKGTGSEWDSDVRSAGGFTYESHFFSFSDVIVNNWHFCIHIRAY